MQPTRLRDRRRLCAGLAVAVTVVHAALLWALLRTRQAPPAPALPVAVELRTMTAPPLPLPAAPAPPPGRVDPPRLPRTPPAPLPEHEQKQLPLEATRSEAPLSGPAPASPVPPTAGGGDAAESVPGPMDATPSAPALPAPSGHGPRSLSVREVEYLRKPAPVYPLASQRARESGVVVLRVLVDTEGGVKSVEVARSSGYRRLDDAALRAVREARFKPYLEDGRPREAVVPHLEISFRREQE